MSARRDPARLDDILVAVSAIDSSLARGNLDDELVCDACRVRVIEIGEAVKAIDPELLNAEPEIPWRELARMRTNHYFATDRSLVAQVVSEELAPLRDAVDRLRSRLAEIDPGTSK